MPLVTLTIQVPDDDYTTLEEIHQRQRLNPTTVITAAITGTCEYYRMHGTLTFLTSGTKDCHGCRFIPGQETDTPAPEGPTPPNIIPGQFNAA